MVERPQVAELIQLAAIAVKAGLTKAQWDVTTARTYSSLAALGVSLVSESSNVSMPAGTSTR